MASASASSGCSAAGFLILAPLAPTFLFIWLTIIFTGIFCRCRCHQLRPPSEALLSRVLSAGVP